MQFAHKFASCGVCGDRTLAAFFNCQQEIQLVLRKWEKEKKIQFEEGMWSEILNSTLIIVNEKNTISMWLINNWSLTLLNINRDMYLKQIKEVITHTRNSNKYECMPKKTKVINEVKFWLTHLDKDRSKPVRWNYWKNPNYGRPTKNLHPNKEES